MRWLINTVLASLTITASATHAFNPQPEWYAGLIVGANYATNVQFTYINDVRPSNPSGIKRPGQLGHDIMGSIGGQIGYRFCDNFRIEFEGIYNNNPYSYLRLNDVTIHSPDTSTQLRLSGQTQSGVGTFNFYYDLFGDYSSKAVPYVGLGIGYAYIVNQIEFYYNDVKLGNNLENFFLENFGVTPSDKSRSGIVGQAIAGISYYLDDYAYFALDGRYLVSQEQTIVTRQTKRVSNQFDVKYQQYSVNIVFNSAFDCG
ncbi:MAG: outer membrane beta-barrel protein [Legionellaceae bacterium]|nr:outer membrane beta-barrel protein [Legionellaceae bacterium]